MSINNDSKQLTIFKHINELSTIVQIIFIISAGISALAIISGYLQSQLLSDMINGKYVSEAEAIANDNREGLIALAQLIILVASAIVFLMWIFRANKNLHSFEKPMLRFSPGWAVGWWFIPFMNLFRPYQIVSEIWKASNPELDPDLNAVQYLPTSAIIGWWWALYLLSNIIAQIGGRLFINGDTADELLNATYTYMVSDGVSIIGIIVLIIMVKRISQNQEIRYNKLTQLSIQEVKT